MCFPTLFTCARGWIGGMMIEGLRSPQLPQTSGKASNSFKFPSIPLEKVFVGKRYFGDSNICKLEIKASLRSFDLTLPDPTSSMPEINSKTSTTQLKNLSLTQKIYFQSIAQIMFAFDPFMSPPHSSQICDQC
jgi:hypothetical protein